MVEAFFGFKKTPFSDNPDTKQLFAPSTLPRSLHAGQFVLAEHGVALLPSPDASRSYGDWRLRAVAGVNH
ncbi:MAG TPA: hypothetical protein VH640_11860 [Bryobacteraceae bacterium]|jgi:hypothetical protein